jgi:hypothetical protein
MKYFIYKEGVRGHGVAWIGSDTVIGKQKCLEFAQKDSDDYHEWVLYQFVEEQDYECDMMHEEIFSCNKKLD